MSEKIISFRIEEDLKDQFEKIAVKNDLTTSQMLRGFVKDAIKEETTKTNQIPAVKNVPKIPNSPRKGRRNRR